MTDVTPETDSITVHETHVETETRLHRAVIIHTGDPPAHDLPLERENIENATRSSERIRESAREMIGNADVEVDVYQPGEFESPIHECLQRQAYLLVILSTPAENDTATAEGKDTLETATDNLRYTWSQRFSLGFEVMVLKYKQNCILPLLEEIYNHE